MWETKNPRGSWDGNTYVEVYYKDRPLQPITREAVVMGNILVEFERQGLVFSSKCEKYRERGFPRLEKCIRRIPTKVLSTKEELTVLVFLSCIALLENHEFVDFKALQLLLKDLPMSIARMQELLLMSKFILNIGGPFKIWKIHEAIQTRLTSATAPAPAGVKKPKLTPQHEDEQDKQDVQATSLEEDEPGEVRKQLPRYVPPNCCLKWKIELGDTTIQEMAAPRRFVLRVFVATDVAVKLILNEQPQSVEELKTIMQDRFKPRLEGDFTLQYEDPDFDGQLSEGNTVFETSGKTVKLTRSQKHNILEAMAEKMYSFKPYPNDREASLEQMRQDIIHEVEKTEKDQMQTTFTLRRKDIVQGSPQVKDFLERMALRNLISTKVDTAHFSPPPLRIVVVKIAETPRIVSWKFDGANASPAIIKKNKAAVTTFFRGPVVRVSEELLADAIQLINPSSALVHLRGYKSAHNLITVEADIRRYLATGDSYRTIANSFRVGVSSVSRIVPDVASAIWDSLVGEFMAVPTTEEWRSIAEGFEERWNFPLCCGAVDGKHVRIQAPDNSGSQFFNYKGTFSIVLLAVVDARYCFRVIDVGGYGRTSDGGILANSAFGQALRSGTLQLPADRLLPGADHRGPQPHVFVADEAFPLRRNLMRPFPGRTLARDRRVFNYRLSRARLVVECAFGVLASQWWLYRRALEVQPDVAEICVKATCVLHNFLRLTTSTPVVRGASTGADMELLPGLGRVAANNSGREAIRVRDTFSSYFSAEGAVQWQASI
ncbi:uncharacterized protein V6R79_024560 [Siganus canaliculatus]